MRNVKNVTHAIIRKGHRYPIAYLSKAIKAKRLTTGPIMSIYIMNIFFPISFRNLTVIIS